MISIENKGGLEYLSTIIDGSVDLILTDPPYIISRESGMEEFSKTVSNGTGKRTEEEWNEYYIKNKEKIDKKKEDINVFKNNYLQYGSIYGKKFAVNTKFGDWDEKFTLEKLEEFVGEYYKKLRKGGTIIMFFDIWKMGLLREIFERAGGYSKAGKPRGFSKIRLVEWAKTNPQPRNQRVTYLSNAKEYAIVGVKGSKATFNSKYDFGTYSYPFPSGKGRLHPTQKSLDLFVDLINKHSNEGALVLDCFLGSGTTALAAHNTNRKFIGCELDEEYFTKAMARINKC